MDLIFILVANDEGLIMAEVGDTPGEDFAPYSATVIETAHKMSLTGNLGNPICSALVLKHGRMLIMHEANVGGETIYLSILCRKVPAGVQRLIQRIIDCLSHALLGHTHQESTDG